MTSWADQHASPAVAAADVGGVVIPRGDGADVADRGRARRRRRGRGGDPPVEDQVLALPVAIGRVIQTPLSILCVRNHE